MRTLFTLLTFLVFIIFSTFLVVFAPYHFYHTTITEGISTSFLTLPKTGNDFLEPLNYEPPLVPNVGENQRFWTKYHFSELDIPLPIRHPSLNFTPIIIQIQGQYHLGLSYRDVKSTELFSFHTMKKRDLDIDLTGQPLFELPFYRLMIIQNSSDYIWQDIFSRRLSLPHKGQKGLWDYMHQLWPISYKTLVYDLFILHARNQFLKKYYDNLGHTIKRIEYYKDSSLGLVEYENKEFNKDFKFYHLYHQTHEKVVMLQLKVRRDDSRADWIKDHFIRNYIHKKSTDDSASPLYAEYKSLSYKDKIDQRGIMTLFAAWSHKPNSCQFMEEIINFLERGTNKEEAFIAPLYAHAYTQCESNFSTIAGKKKESVKVQHERRMKEARAREIEDARKREITQVPDEFEGQEQKMEFLLKKAKEKGPIDSVFDPPKSIITY